MRELGVYIRHFKLHVENQHLQHIVSDEHIICMYILQNRSGRVHSALDINTIYSVPSSFFVPTYNLTRSRRQQHPRSTNRYICPPHRCHHKEQRPTQPQIRDHSAGSSPISHSIPHPIQRGIVRTPKLNTKTQPIGAHSRSVCHQFTSLRAERRDVWTFERSRSWTGSVLLCLEVSPRWVVSSPLFLS